MRLSPRHIYVLLFKPRGVVCTSGDAEGRPRAIDLVDHPAGARLYPVGRLDVDSSGLLLLTNDGELANRMTHPRYKLPKIYEVTVSGDVSLDTVKRLERGLFLGGRRGGSASRTRGSSLKGGSASRTRGSSLKLVKRDRNRSRLLMELHEGRNRQIRRMMAQVGHPVRRLRRVGFGPIKLKGLRVGEWREPTSVELSALKRAAFGRR